jgi:hypothetical protein
VTAVAPDVSASVPANQTFLDSEVSVIIPDSNGDISSPKGAAATYTFEGPVVTAVSPETGPIKGGNTVTITGSGFTGASKVCFALDTGGESCVAPNPPGATDTQVRVTAPDVSAHFETGRTSMYSPVTVWLPNANGPIPSRKSEADVYRFEG